MLRGDEKEPRGCKYPTPPFALAKILPETGFVPQGNFVMFWCFIPYSKSFIDHACSIKMAGYMFLVYKRFLHYWIF